MSRLTDPKDLDVYTYASADLQALYPDAQFMEREFPNTDALGVPDEVAA